MRRPRFDPIEVAAALTAHQWKVRALEVLPSVMMWAVRRFGLERSYGGPVAEVPHVALALATGLPLEDVEDTLRRFIRAQRLTDQQVQVTAHEISLRAQQLWNQAQAVMALEGE